jgi:PadR family transcriptional regulator, regulatory protein PadR
MDNEDSKPFKPIERLKKKLGVDILYIWILTLLKDEKKYAYEIRNELKEKYGFAPATVTSYAVLYKLEKEGFVEVLEQSLKPNRKYYQITDKGNLLIAETKEIMLSVINNLF